MKHDVGEAFALIVELATLLGVREINQLPGCWEHALDGRWRIAVNGHAAPMRCASGALVGPYHAYVELHGWPAALLTSADGMTFGDCEDALIAALQEAVARVPRV